MLENVVLSGAGTLFRNFEVRLQKELRELVPLGQSVHVWGLDDRQNAAFVGGSIVASLPSFDSMWITRAEYGEVGSGIVARKCK